MLKIIQKFRVCATALSTAVFALSLALVATPGALAQAPVASIHGHTNDPAGVPLKNGTVKLTTTVAAKMEDTKFPYSFDTDNNGDYKGTGIAPGTYTVVLFQAGKSIDFTRDVKFAAGTDTETNFDLSRADYIAKMTPEQKKALEEFKKKNAEVSSENNKIKNLNALLVQARTDMKAGNYDTAIASMQQATQVKPDEALLWYTMGDAQLGAKKYDDAVVSYKKSLELDAASKKPNPQVSASADNNLGQALANTGKTDDAVAAYEAAAKLDPTKAGMYYLNESIVLYKLGKNDDSAAAADKAIAADPTKVDAYYLKGQDLISKATVDPKTQKVTAPPECVAAYQKYLDLAPNGPHAEEIKQILDGIGEKINSSYKAGKKK